MVGETTKTHAELEQELATLKQIAERLKEPVQRGVIDIESLDIDLPREGLVVVPFEKIKEIADAVAAAVPEEGSIGKVNLSLGAEGIDTQIDNIRSDLIKDTLFMEGIEVLVNIRSRVEAASDIYKGAQGESIALVTDSIEGIIKEFLVTKGRMQKLATNMPEQAENIKKAISAVETEFKEKLPEYVQSLAASGLIKGDSKIVEKVKPEKNSKAVASFVTRIEDERSAAPAKER